MSLLQKKKKKSRRESLTRTSTRSCMLNKNKTSQLCFIMLGATIWNHAIQHHMKDLLTWFPLRLYFNITSIIKNFNEWKQQSSQNNKWKSFTLLIYQNTTCLLWVHRKIENYLTRIKLLNTDLHTLRRVWKSLDPYNAQIARVWFPS